MFQFLIAIFSEDEGGAVLFMEDDAGGRKRVREQYYTIGIFPGGASSPPSHLLFFDKPDYDTWVYHLTLVSSSEHINGTFGLYLYFIFLLFFVTSDTVFFVTLRWAQRSQDRSR